MKKFSLLGRNLTRMEQKSIMGGGPGDDPPADPEGEEFEAGKTYKCCFTNCGGCCSKCVPCSSSCRCRTSGSVLVEC